MAERLDEDRLSRIHVANYAEVAEALKRHADFRSVSLEMDASVAPSSAMKRLRASPGSIPSAIGGVSQSPSILKNTLPTVAHTTCSSVFSIMASSAPRSIASLRAKILSP